MQSLWKLVTVGVLLVWPSNMAWGDEGQTADKPSPLVVATKYSPPFAFKNADGKWSGISIELWRQLTDELNLEYELRELSLDEMLAGLESGELDAAVAAISVTAERHQRIDFCHPHFTTGLGVAVARNGQVSNWSLVRQASKYCPCRSTRRSTRSRYRSEAR